MYLTRSAGLAGAILMAATAAAHADVTAAQTLSVASRPTDYTTALDFNRFDPALGTLTGVVYTLQATVSGSIGVENTGAMPELITANLSAAVDLDRPAGSLLAMADPYIAVSFNAAAFDGTVDFGGTSGATFGGLSQTASSLPNPHEVTDPADLALFTGPGTLQLMLTATGTSGASSAGPLASDIPTFAAETASVSYVYAPVTPAPEPASVALLAGGFLSLALVRRRNL